MFLTAYVSNALPIGVKIIGGLVILRVLVEYLGMEGFGIAAQYQSIVTLGYGLVNALAFNYIVKTPWDGVKGDEDFGILLRWIFCVSLACALVVVILSYPLAYVVLKDGKYFLYVCIAIATLPLIAIYIALSAKMCAEKRQLPYNLITAVSTAAAIVLVCLLTYWGGLPGALVGLGCFYVPAFALQAFVNRRQLIAAWRLTIPVASYNSRPLLKFAFVGILSAGLAIIVQVVIRNNVLTEIGWIGVGEWQTVTKISESYLMLASIPLFTYFLPRYSALTNAKDMHSLVVKTLTVSLFIVIFTGVAILIFWGSLIVPVIGAQFSNLAEFFKIQLLGDVFKIISWVFVAVALAGSKMKQVVILELLFAFAYCSISYALIPSYKINGAIIGYGVAYFLLATTLFVLYFKKRHE
jgi:O-antigen/teichoic acid export membrane protein